MSRIFINYRRSDTPTHASRIYEWLSERYGEDAVFMDVDAIQPGLDFVDAIDRAVGESDVVITLIGREWVVDVNGRRRLDEPEDFVRLEIEAALDKEKRVIPVLVEGADMPLAEVLPQSLHRLTRRHAFELTDRRWQYDKEQLLKSLDAILGAPAIEPEPPAEPERPPIWPPPQPVRPKQPPTPAPAPAVQPTPAYGPPAGATDKGKLAVLWGWIFVGATLLLFFFVPVAIGLGVAAIVRSGGKRTGAGVAIIAASLVACVISLVAWAAAGA